MELELIKRLGEVTGELSKLVIDFKPETDAEWEALEKMTTAHKQLRSIDKGSLRQAQMKV